MCVCVCVCECVCGVGKGRGGGDVRDKDLLLCATYWSLPANWEVSVNVHANTGSVWRIFVSVLSPKTVFSPRILKVKERQSCNGHKVACSFLPYRIPIWVHNRHHDQLNCIQNVSHLYYIYPPKKKTTTKFEKQTSYNKITTTRNQ